MSNLLSGLRHEHQQLYQLTPVVCVLNVEGQSLQHRNGNATVGWSFYEVLGLASVPTIAPRRSDPGKALVSPATHGNAPDRTPLASEPHLTKVDSFRSKTNLSAIQYCSL